MFNAIVTLTSAGTDTGPIFNLSGATGSVIPATASKAVLLSGLIVSCDNDNNTQIIVTSTGACNDSITLDISGIPTTTTTTTSTTTTTTTLAGCANLIPTETFIYTPSEWNVSGARFDSVAGGDNDVKTNTGLTYPFTGVIRVEYNAANQLFGITTNSAAGGWTQINYGIWKNSSFEGKIMSGSVTDLGLGQQTDEYYKFTYDGAVVSVYRGSTTSNITTLSYTESHASNTDTFYLMGYNQNGDIWYEFIEWKNCI